MKVFLGGTVNNSTWRDEIIPLLKIDYFNPVVKEWNEEAMQRELYEREHCDICLYVLTPKMEGWYSIAEVIDDSCKKNNKIVFCYLANDGKTCFSRQQIEAMNKIGNKVSENGSIWKKSLTDVVEFLNSKHKIGKPA